MKAGSPLNTFLMEDSRGSLEAVEVFKNTELSFRRYFIIRGLKGINRGGHAHKFTDQVLHVISGSLTINLEYKQERSTVNLNHESKPIFLPKLTWVEMNNMSDDSIILVIASDEYKIENSIRNFKDFQIYQSLEIE